MQIFSDPTVSGIVIAIGGAAGLGIIQLIYRKFRVNMSLPKRVERMEADSKEAKSILSLILKINYRQNQAHIATMEALQGNCNGNVTRALETMREITVQMGDFANEKAMGVDEMKHG